jgi:hypothetical protein
MNLDIFKIHDPSGKMSKESYVFKNFKEEYDFIIENTSNDLPFKERVYLILNKIEKPKCKNPNCNNPVKFKNSTIGYLEYCSNRCIGLDPNIIKLKETKSIEKYGTKTPAESNKIKEKIKNTNNLKYGGNSPMSSKKIRNKSKETLLVNWGVENPAKSKDIQNKRIESFKKSDYKENYEKTSLERYGTKHPWMNSEIHQKTIEFFYKDYKKRITESIDNDKFLFIGFEKGDKTNLNFHCKNCKNDFNILTYQFYYRIKNNNSICTKCFPISESSSIDQLELFNLIKNNYSGEIITNVKNIITPYEIDIYLPDLKIGFEFNGVFWHSDKFKSKNYHLNKYQKSIENGINLYTIWEDDWTIKRDICESFILNKLGNSEKLMARKTILKEVDYNTSREFLDKNHLQGDCKSSKRIGLYYNNSLISLMTFSKLRLPLNGKNLDKDSWELTRFCSKTGFLIIGGASKLLKYFIDTYSPNEIQTYSDNLISDGKLYEKLGFDYKWTSDPGYWYVINGIRSHRFNWRKSKLVKLGHDSNKSGEEIMSELGYWKIYNAGNKKWILNRREK